LALFESRGRGTEGKLNSELVVVGETSDSNVLLVSLAIKNDLFGLLAGALGALEGCFNDISKRSLIRSQNGTFRTAPRTKGLFLSSRYAPTPRFILLGFLSALKASVTPRMGSCDMWQGV
jgi:hypothetical protein